MSCAAVLDALAWAWFIGLVACLIRAIDAAETEQTPHGHAVILPPGFALALIWPLVLALQVIRQLMRQLIGGARRG